MSCFSHLNALLVSQENTFGINFNRSIRIYILDSLSYGRNGDTESCSKRENWPCGK